MHIPHYASIATQFGMETNVEHALPFSLLKKGKVQIGYVQLELYIIISAQGYFGLDVTQVYIPPNNFPK